MSLLYLSQETRLGEGETNELNLNFFPFYLSHFSRSFVGFVGGDQCDQIGRVFKVLGDIFSYKSSQIILVAFGAILKDITLS